MCPNRGTITIDFDRPVTNPRISVMGLGGPSGVTRFGASGTMTSVPAGATMTVAGGATNLEVINSGTTFRTTSSMPGTWCNSSGSGDDGTAGCGTLNVTGTDLTKITFAMSILSTGGSGTYGTSDWNPSDGFGMLVSLPDHPLPTAVADTPSTDSATAKVIDVQANDSAGTGFTKVATSTKFRTSAGWTITGGGTTATAAGIGTYTVNGSGTVTFTPVLGYNGTTPALVYEFMDSSDSVAWNTIATTVTDPVPPAPPVTSPAAGSVTNHNTPTIVGTGEPGNSVTVKNAGGTTLCTDTVDGAGDWSCTPGSALPEGSNTIRVTQTNGFSKTSPETVRTFTVDTTAPAAPVISTPANGSTTNDNTPTVSGTGEAGATVTVKEGATTICTATVDGSGNWSCVSSSLADGSHTFTATQTDPAGNTSASASTTFTVDTTAPAAPVISTPANGSTTNDNTPTVSGTGEAGATVTVKEGATTICTATVDGSGNWSCVSSSLADGAHTFTATQTDPAGNTSASASTTFTVDTTAPAAPVITGPADGAHLNTGSPTITGSGEPGATVTVTEGGTTICTATVNGSGSWSCVPTAPLSEGPHTIRATQTDAAGNTSAPSAPVSFTVDTTAPASPTITGPTDGSTTADPKPTISGTGEPGATVTVKEGGNTICTALVTGAGTWSCVPNAPLTNGTHTLTATQTDPAGNTSPPSAPVHLVVAPPAAVNPQITGPADGTTTANRRPEISGTGKPGATITVLNSAGKTICSAVVDGNGAWSCVPQRPLARGLHTFQIVQVDQAGHRVTTTQRVRVKVKAKAKPRTPRRLPDTGADYPAWVIFLGMGSVALGMGMVVSVRRRRTDGGNA